MAAKIKLLQGAPGKGQLMAAKVRISVDQAKLFEKGKRAPREKGAPRQKKRREDLPENQVKDAIVGFLKAKGWIVSPQVRGLFRRAEGGPPFTLGVKGQCDTRAHRPIYPGGKRWDARKTATLQQYLEVESKRLGAKPSPDQRKYIRDLNATGTPATWADSLDSFMEWYARLSFDTWQ